MRKRTIIILLACAVAVAIGIGTTVAYLVASPRTVENTFTAGKVEITLTETTGAEYKMAPGVNLEKDPTVTVKADSEDCWLFVKVEKPTKFDDFCTYGIQSGWAPLEGHSGVYYKRVVKSTADQTFKILKGDQITVLDTVTEEQLKTVGESLDLKFTAGAIQSAGIDSADEAWHALNS
ncbi:MAG: hypothetical protein IKZ03_02595 [Clostridia bacterium]|nr:hypothetical protein [Clostridia bacterium]